MSIVTSAWSGYGMTQDYGPTTSTLEPAQYGYPHFHDGIDYAVWTGTPVRAPFDGTIVEAGDSGDGYGIKVVVRRSDGATVVYGHLQDVAVAPGTAVRSGDLLGHSDNTGNSTGPHLHVGAAVDGRTIDPRSFPDVGGQPALGDGDHRTGIVAAAVLVGLALVLFD